MIQTSSKDSIGSVVSNDLVAFYLSCFENLSPAEKAHVLTLTLIYGIHSLQKHGQSLDALRTGGVGKLESLVADISHAPVSPLMKQRTSPEAHATLVEEPIQVQRKAKPSKLTPTFGLYPSWWGHREHAPSKLLQMQDRNTGHNVLVAEDFDRLQPANGEFGPSEENLHIGGWVTESILRQQQGQRTGRAPTLEPFEQVTSPIENWKCPKRMVDQITQTNQPYVRRVHPEQQQPEFVKTESPPKRHYVESASSFYSDYSSASEQASSPGRYQVRSARERIVKGPKLLQKPRGEAILTRMRPETAVAQKQEKKPGHWYTITLDDKTGEASVQYEPKNMSNLHSDAELEKEETLLSKSLGKIPDAVTEKFSKLDLLETESANRSFSLDLNKSFTAAAGHESDETDEVIVYDKKSFEAHSTSPRRHKRKSKKKSRSSTSGSVGSSLVESPPRRSRPKTRGKHKASTSVTSASPSLGSLENFSIHSKASTANNFNQGTSALDIALSFLNNNEFINSLDLQVLEEP